MKRCPKCKATTDFYSTGTLCRTCKKAATKAWRAANPGVPRKEDREKKRARCAKHRATPGRRKSQREHDKRRRDLLREAPGGPFDPSREDYKPRYARFLGWCAFCLEVPYSTVDHAIPITRSGTNFPENIYPACRPCNSSKNNRILYDEWVPPIFRNPKDFCTLLAMGAGSQMDLKHTPFVRRRFLEALERL